jgi:hypothetical protein
MAAIGGGGGVSTDVLQQIEEICERLNKLITGNESWVISV